MASIQDILAQVEPPEKSVTLCLKGSLVARYQELEGKLGGAEAAMSLAGGESARIAEQMEALRAEMLAHEHAFVFRALPPGEFEDRVMALRPKRAADADPDVYRHEFNTWLNLVVAASCVDPVMTAEQAAALSGKLSRGQWELLHDAAWEVNNEAVGIPFSYAASALSQLSDAKSKQPEPSESDGPSSLAGGNAENEPSSSENPAAKSLAG